MQLALAIFGHILRKITILLCSYKGHAVESYLGVEPVVFQERVGHLPLARGLFQSHIPCGCGASQTIRENLAKQRVIIPIRSHIPTERA